MSVSRSAVSRSSVTHRPNWFAKITPPLNSPPAITAAGEYQLVDLLPACNSISPVCVATPPGETNRLFVVERAGRIFVINDLTKPDQGVVSGYHPGSCVGLDQQRRTEGLSSLAFHPDFTRTTDFFVTYNTVTNTSQGRAITIASPNIAPATISGRASRFGNRVDHSIRRRRRPQHQRPAFWSRTGTFTSRRVMKATAARATISITPKKSTKTFSPAFCASTSTNAPPI